MAGFQNFRTAINGFKREDVVHYIEYMNNKHNSQLEQLNTQLQTAQAQLAQAKAAPAGDGELQVQLDAANARIAELEAELAACRQEKPAGAVQTGDELEAYRRAERTERMARERAAQIYAQANAVLADATLKVEGVSAQIGAVADQMTAQFQEYQASVSSTKATLQEAVAAMYAIHPEE